MVGVSSRTGRAAVALVLMLSPVQASAQTGAQPFDALRAQLKSGDMVWVTGQTRRESRGRIVDLRESAVVLTTAQGRGASASLGRAQTVVGAELPAQAQGRPASPLDSAEPLNVDAQAAVRPASNALPPASSPS